jgi:hypothetical protein
MSITNRRALLGRLLALPAAVTAMTKASFGQVTNAPIQDPNYEHKFLAVNVLRLINTAEAWHNRDNGFYADMNQLVASSVIEQIRARLKSNENLGDSLQSHVRFLEKEIVPGWALAFKVSDDRKGYVADLTDVSGKVRCNFSSNERGVIYQNLPLDSLATPTGVQASTEREKPVSWEATLNSPKSFGSSFRNALKGIVPLPFLICLCKVCTDFPVCCSPCCNSCSTVCGIGFGCACCVNAGCQSCPWCCGT